MLYLILFPLLLLAGVVLLIKGLCGRQLDEHPVCAHCGFDLVGKPHDSHVCSECGTDLASSDAIRVGNRARRPRLIYLGVTVLVVALLWAGLLIASASGTNFTRYEPTFWLVHDMHSLIGPVRRQVTAELSRRITTGKLSKAQSSHIADQVLQLQAEPSRIWDPAWGDLFSDADLSGAVSAEQWKQFGLHAPQLALIIRSRVTSGDVVTYAILDNAAKVGNRPPIILRKKNFMLNIDGHSIHYAGGGGGRLSPRDRGSSTSSIPTASFSANLAPGKHTLKVVFDVDLYRSFNDNEKPFAHNRIEMAGDFELLPPNRSSITINRDPALRSAVEKALKVTVTRERWSLQVNVEVNHVPVGIGYEVIVHGAKHQSRVGELACPAGTSDHRWSLSGSLNDIDDDVVDVELKPSIEAAQSTLDTFELWDQPILFKDVKVRHP